MTSWFDLHFFVTSSQIDSTIRGRAGLRSAGLIGARIIRRKRERPRAADHKILRIKIKFSLFQSQT
jgi:hypothetical protein